MHSVQRSAMVNYSARQMFDLVNDIESYPKYMDGCVGARILKRGDSWLEARLELGKGALTQSFVTRNQLEPPHRMTLSLVDGPFSRFEGQWTFTPLGDNACRVQLQLAFAMKNRLLGMAAGKLLEAVTNRQVDALCARARVIYG